MKLKQSTVVLTGATGGIGRELAAVLARRGARLVLVGRNQLLLNSLAGDLPGEHTAVACDLCNPQGRETLLRTLKDLNQTTDLLINNAGASDFTLFENQPEARIAQIIEINLLVPMLLTQALLPMMTPGGAQILNIGSTFGSIGYPGFSTYCASKFGLRGFSEALGRELSDRRIVVQYAAPRATRTALNSASVISLNERLGNQTDDPHDVANRLCDFIVSGKNTLYLGWPEKLLVRLNALCASLINRAIKPKLPIVKQTIQEQYS